MYGCKNWTLGKNEETRLDAFEMKRLRKILRVSHEMLSRAHEIIFSGRELAFTFATCHRDFVCCLSSVVCDVGAPYSSG